MDKIDKVMDLLDGQYSNYFEPLHRKLGNGNHPFRVLISTILSLRTKDAVTAKASEQLFKQADTPRGILRLSEEEIRKAIYPAGFYKTKARTIRYLAEFVLKNRGRVPDTMEGLLALKGVGRKTANLVLSEGFGKPGLCVDTHVHRISNRLGLVRTITPEETEFALRDLLPQRYWRGYNTILVAHGQQVCAPISPKCSVCQLSGLCMKRGVDRHR